ncbi:MAG: 50S ribosomal protein L25/general stress protein Ctc [Desulfobacterales bacterium]|nr:50S ribosomal protein L25/general stress protein Ctc [Desulfobacterales bacterium]
MEQLELKANIRTATGKGQARSLRREGKMPAVFYGPLAEPLMLSVGMNNFENVMKKSKRGQVLFNLSLQDGEKFTKSVMIKELQTHPVSRNLLHVDFYEVPDDRKIRVKVPVVTKGKSKGVEFGGLLQIIRRELEVLCYPKHVPELIEIDVTDLDVGDAVHVREISLEGDVEIPADVNFTVVTILSPKGKDKTEEEEEAEEGVEE